MIDLREKLHALIDEIVNAIEQQSTGAEWVDQKSSPLGRDRHMRLVRAGTLPGKKDGRRVLVRRADIERYLQTKTVTKSDPAADLEREAVRILNEHQRKSA
jgi:excisionase family DNA binding protein